MAGVSMVWQTLTITNHHSCFTIACYCIIRFLGKTMLAGYLMGKGAKLQLTDKDGDNALHWAGFKGKYRS